MEVMTNNILHFAYALDVKSRISTTLIGILGAASIYLTIWLALNRAPSITTKAIAMTIAFGVGLIFLMAYLLAPSGCVLNETELRILRRGWRPVIIPFSTMTEAGIMQKEKLAGAWRKRGSSGFWGEYGSYNNHVLGDFKMYATSHDRYVYIRAEKLYLLTPCDAEGLVSALRQRGINLPVN